MTLPAELIAQGYDKDPPRCFTCVYFRREPHTLYKTTTRTTRRGKVVTSKARVKSHPTKNPIVDRCSFGNFLAKPYAICNEWHGKDGARLESDEVTNDC